MLTAPYMDKSISDVGKDVLRYMYMSFPMESHGRGPETD